MPKTLREKAETLLEPVTKEEYVAWLDHPLTKALRLHIQADVEDLKDQWVNGDFTHESVEGTNQRNAQALGRAQEADLILDLIVTLIEDN